MVLLIGRTDIAVYRQISDSVYDNVLNQHITDAQFSDIQKLMGSDFFNDLIRNSGDAKYTELLGGGDYTYNSIIYSNYGLKAVIVHYFHARYVMFGSNTDTPFGFVEKLTPESRGADIAAKRSLSKDSKNIAFNYWENVKLFLDRNANTYPLWKNGCQQNNKSRFKIYKVDGASKEHVPTRQRFSFE